MLAVQFLGLLALVGGIFLAYLGLLWLSQNFRRITLKPTDNKE